MNDDTDLDQADRDALGYDLSDHPLEATGYAGRAERMARMTASYLAGTIFVCCRVGAARRLFGRCGLGELDVRARIGRGLLRLMRPGTRPQPLADRLEA